MIPEKMIKMKKRIIKMMKRIIKMMKRINSWRSLSFLVLPDKTGQRVHYHLLGKVLSHDRGNIEVEKCCFQQR